MGAALGWPDLACAALAAGLVLASLDSTGRQRLLYFLCLVLVAGVYVANPENRIYSYHGFMHLGIVYQIMEVGFPPLHPLLAGEGLRYMSGAHALVAGLSRIADLSPAWIFAVLNVCAVGVAIPAFFAAGLLLLRERRAAVLGVVLTLFAFSFVALARRFDARFDWIEPQGMPPIDKFTNLNAAPMAIACFGLFMWALMRAVADPPGRNLRTPYLVLFLSVIGAAFFYPLQWLMMAVGGGAAAIVLLTLDAECYWKRLLWVGGLAGCATLLLAPYMLAVTSVESASLLGLADLRHVGVYTAQWLLLALPLLLLIAVAHRPVRAMLRANRDLGLVMLAVAVPNALISIFLSGAVTPGVEYKFRMASFLPMGLVAGTALEHVRKRSGVAAFLILTVLFVPFVNSLRYKATWSGALDPVVERGSQLHHADPLQDELYTWISTETDPRAAFIDGSLAIPVLGRRALWVGLGTRAARAQRAGPGRFHDGWLIPPQTTIAVTGGAGEEHRARAGLARAVLLGLRPGLVAGEVVDRARAGGLDAVYVVVRDGRVAARLDEHPAYRRVFSNPAASVFRVDGP